MSPDAALVQAVQSAILASAHLAAFERVSAATEACQRLGRLSSGRWRAAARDLERIEEDLERALEQAGEEVARRAGKLDVQEEALWTAGDAAGLFELFRGDAMDSLEEGCPAARLLAGDLLFGVTFLDDPDVPNRGTTLLFAWPEPLAPASWSWEGNWVVASGDADGEEELDLAQVSDLQASERLLAEAARLLGLDAEHAEQALVEAASALTRVSLLATLEDADEEEEEEEDEGHGLANGHP